MEREKALDKLRGIKSILYHISEIKGDIVDREYAFVFLAEEIAFCIEVLETE